jgi:hypothetical protein
MVFILRNQNCVSLGEAYAGTSVNMCIFRHHALITVGNTQLASFYRSSSELVIVKRIIGEERVSEVVIPGSYKISDAHNAINLGVDSSGYIHLSYDQHASPLRYRRSIHPWSIQEFSDEQSMTGRFEDTVTYPTFICGNHSKDNKELFYFLYRHGTPGGGEARVKILDHETGSWIDVEKPLLSGKYCKPWGAGPYWNNPIIDSEGRLHLSFMWRGPNLEQVTVNNNHISYACFSKNFSQWSTLLGYSLQLPITPLTSEVVVALPLGSNMINQTSMAIDHSGQPHIVFYANDSYGVPQYYHIYWSGKEWKKTCLSNRKTSFSLSGRGTLSLPISRPALLIDRSNQAVVIFRGDLTQDRLALLTLRAPNYELQKSSITFLTKNSLGQSEPVIDFQRWQSSNILSMLVQAVSQPPGDDSTESSITSSSISIVEWSLSRIKCKKRFYIILSNLTRLFRFDKTHKNKKV